MEADKELGLIEGRAEVDRGQEDLGVCGAHKNLEMGLRMRREWRGGRPWSVQSPEESRKFGVGGGNLEKGGRGKM